MSIDKGSHFVKFSIGGKEVMRWSQEGTWSGTAAMFDGASTDMEQFVPANWPDHV